MSYVQSIFGVYSAFIRNAFLEMLAYRLRYYTGILTYLLFVSVHFFIWQAVYAGRGEGAEVNGFTLAQMVTYVTVGWIARSLYFSDIDYNIDDMVKTGQISTYLIRPVNFQGLMLSQALGGTLFRMCFFTVPIGIALLLVFPILPPAGIQNFVLFFVSTAVAFLILAELNFVVGLMAFSFKSIRGLIRAKYFIVQLCSGLLLPLTFFPEAVRVVLEFLPFQAIAYIPLRFYLGQVPDSEMGQIFLLQFFWISVLLFLGQWMWKRAIVKLTLQGG